MPSTKASSSSSKKVFDISKPGKSAPSATSKPIIITNRPIMHDPMVAGDTGAETEPAEKLAATKPSGRLIITPTTDMEAAKIESAAKNNSPKPEAATDSLPPKPPVEAAVPKNETPDEQAVTVKVSAPAAADSSEKDETAPPEAAAETPEAVPAAETKTEEIEKPGESPEADEKSDDKTLKPQTPEEQEAAAQEAAKLEAEHKAAIQKMADSKQYYLPINSVEKRKTKHFVVAGVIIAVLLVVAWADVALDAGLIHLGSVKAVTHFFSS